MCSDTLERHGDGTRTQLHRDTLRQLTAAVERFQKGIVLPAHHGNPQRPRRQLLLIELEFVRGLERIITANRNQRVDIDRGRP